MAEDHGGFEEVRENLSGNPMRKLLAYALPYWPRLTAGIVASFLTRFARLVPPIVVGAAINRVVTGSGEPGMLARVGLLPSGTIEGEAARLALLQQLVVIAALAYLVRSITRFVSRYLLQSSAQKIQRDLRNDTYDHLQRLSLDFYANHQTGGMMSILNSDVNRLEKFLNTEFRQIIRVVATVGGIAAVLYFWYSKKLALIALAPVPIIGVASWFFLSWIEPRYKSIRETVARLNTRLENNLSGAAVIKAFDRYDFESRRVADQSQEYHDEKVGALRLRRGFFSALRLLTGVVFVVVLLVAGRDIIAGDPNALSAGGVAVFFLYLRRLYSPMRRVGKSANKYQLAKSSAERVFGLLAQEPTVTQPDDPYEPASIGGSVTFDSVEFGYTDDERVIDGVSLDVPAGATVGLAGTTGAGKSTLLKLVPRFHDVDDGSVSVDGRDVREYDLQSLREEVAVVEQQPYLFSGTVAENVAYGDHEVLDGERAGEPAARDRVREAAAAAEAHEFISDLPDGYDTEIGERGIKLSGGQRQRVAIARALLNDPAIIVFDEATSDVDTETEDRIQESLDELIEDRTAFVIAHRLSTIREADRIVVMDDGRIAESGTHADLLAADGEYADLWRGQADRTAAGAD
ncbi:ABC transporter ATP-binding protein [Halomicrobium salinisoli]|uniref:ABC transporter ATP-binding protein n=1 Tax=Halomicrobium salinisoli TaxID=2878391 RepID=UPI001CEFE1F0|nr:ABC transporter ATP-binding protein [Halomicrobium salinisoli]